MPLNQAQVTTAEPSSPTLAAAPAPTPAPVTAPSPAPGAQVPSPKDKGTKALPEAVKTDPAVRLTLEKKIPGVAFSPDLEGNPEAAAKMRPLEDSVNQIQNELGLLFFRTQDSGTVMFNPAVVGPEEVKAADSQNKIYDIFPSYGELVGVSSAKPPPQGGNITPPSAQGMPKAPPKAIQNQTQKARIQNLTPQLPPGMSNTVGSLQTKAI